jgi:hypothetical protein
VKRQAQDAYNAELQAKLATTVWAANCGSWYKHDGKITNNWSGSTIEFWRQMRRADLEAYDLVAKPGPARIAA